MNRLPMEGVDLVRALARKAKPALLRVLQAHEAMLSRVGYLLWRTIRQAAPRLRLRAVLVLKVIQNEKCLGRQPMWQTNLVLAHQELKLLAPASNRSNIARNLRLQMLILVLIRPSRRAPVAVEAPAPPLDSGLLAGQETREGWSLAAPSSKRGRWM